MDILTCHLQLEMKSETKCSFSMYRAFININYLPLLPIVNLPLMEFSTHFNSFLPSTYKVGTVYSLIYTSKDGQFGLCDSQCVIHTALVCLKKFS